MTAEPIPEGRVVRDPDDEFGVLRDCSLYGSAYVREPIPSWWGSLRLTADDLRPFSDDDRRVLEGKSPRECQETAGGTPETPTEEAS